MCVEWRTFCNNVVLHSMAVLIQTFVARNEKLRETVNDLINVTMCVYARDQWLWV